MKKKKFDAVAMVREIRNKLDAEYAKNPLAFIASLKAEDAAYRKEQAGKLKQLG